MFNTLKSNKIIFRNAAKSIFGFIKRIHLNYISKFLYYRILFSYYYYYTLQNKLRIAKKLISCFVLTIAESFLGYENYKSQYRLPMFWFNRIVVKVYPGRRLVSSSRIERKERSLEESFQINSRMVLKRLKCVMRRIRSLASKY